jgi:hypothetical protein
MVFQASWNTRMYVLLSEAQVQQAAEIKVSFPKSMLD